MRSLVSSIAFGALLAAAACDTTPRGRDAAAGLKTSEVAVRFEVAGDAVPSVSMLAFRASVSGIGADDVLSIVDPLSASAPDGACSFRDVAGAARALGALGGKVELEPLAGWHLELGGARAAVSPSPRVYPDLAKLIGGVVAEAGPLDLRSATGDNFAPSTRPGAEGFPANWPDGLALVDPSGSKLALTPPPRPYLVGPEGGAVPANARLSVGGDLVFGLSGADSSFLELRPFGATWALACPVSGPGRDRVVIKAAEVERLASLRVPVSVEAVARTSQPVLLGGSHVRLTLEVRSSSVLELVP